MAYIYMYVDYSDILLLSFHVFNVEKKFFKGGKHLLPIFFDLDTTMVIKSIKSVLRRNIR